MKLRKFTLEDYETLVNMYYEFAKEVYHNRKIGYKYSFYKIVDSWIDKKHDIILAERDGGMVGFTIGYIDNMGGITEPVYNGEIAYVIPSKRGSRASYMLYKNVVSYASELGLRLVSNGRIENGVAGMVQKHFNVKPTYFMFEKEI